MMALILAAALIAQTTEPFDLVCSGTRTDIGARVTESPTSYRLRLDLEAGRWCQDECERTGSIAEVDATRITIYDSQNNGVSQRSTDTSLIDRVSGRHHVFSSVRSRGVAIGHSIDAQCEREPFSGMPDETARF